MGQMLPVVAVTSDAVCPVVLGGGGTMAEEHIAYIAVLWCDVAFQVNLMTRVLWCAVLCRAVLCVGLM